MPPRTASVHWSASLAPPMAASAPYWGVSAAPPIASAPPPRPPKTTPAFCARPMPFQASFTDCLLLKRSKPPRTRSPRPPRAMVAPGIAPKGPPAAKPAAPPAMPAAILPRPPRSFPMPLKPALAPWAALGVSPYSWAVCCVSASVLILSISAVFAWVRVASATSSWARACFWVAACWSAAAWARASATAHSAAFTAAVWATTESATWPIENTPVVRKRSRAAPMASTLVDPSNACCLRVSANCFSAWATEMAPCARAVCTSHSAVCRSSSDFCRASPLRICDCCSSPMALRSLSASSAALPRVSKNSPKCPAAEARCPLTPSMRSARAW